MEDITKKLQSVLGLTDTEATIYAATLPYQAVGVNELAARTGIKRTTIYYAAGSLVFKGFMAHKTIKGKTVFSAISPEFLQRSLETQKEQIENQEKDLMKLVPELRLLKKSPLFTTEVKQFQGVDGVKAVYEEALYNQTRSWDAISPSMAFTEQYGQDFWEYVLQKRKERGIKTRTLWEVKKKIANHPLAHGLKREQRLMPHSMHGTFQSNVLIFDTHVALVTPASNPGAILIQSEELHNVFRSLFNTIWNISIPIQ